MVAIMIEKEVVIIVTRCSCFLCDLDSKNSLDNLKIKGYSLLMGNGIILSHDDAFRFEYGKIKEQLLLVHKEANQDEKFNPECPEKLLNICRIEVTMKILEWYKDKFSSFSPNLTKLQQYVNGFNHIYNLNYDPISYRSIFNHDTHSDNPNNFTDGFVMHNNPDGISLSGIKKNLEKDNEKNIMYIHGAFHILYHYRAKPNKKNGSKDLYKKITATQKNTLLDEIVKKHEEIEKAYHTLDPSQDYDDIFCVLESKPIYKKAWIKHDPYLNYCFERLGKEKNILTLGCSFSNDDHLLEKILLNPDLESLNIGVFNDNDRKKICQAYKRIANYPNANLEVLGKNIQKICFICTKKLKNCLWESA